MSYVRLNPGLGNFLDDLAAAITRMEGSCSAPGVCTNNNPGNLRAGPGQTGTDSRGVAIFPDFATGQSALLNQEQLNVNRGLTLSEFFSGKQGVYSGYAPAADSNSPSAYTGNVASWLGIPADVPLSELMGNSSGVPEDVSAPEGFDLSASDGSISPLAIAGVALLGFGLIWAVAG